MSGDTSVCVDLTRSSPPGSPPRAQSSSAAKRKAQDTGGNSGKKAKAASEARLVQLNGRKLVFNQTPYKRTIPLKARMALNMLLAEAHEDDAAQLDEIPEEHWAVIVMAGHEQTSATDATFIKAIRQEISKSQKDVAELLTNELLSPLVSKLFSQANYGFVASDLGAASSKLPAGLQIRVWEAQDLDKYFPAADIPALTTRREERAAARETCIGIAMGLDDMEKLELVKGLKDDDDKGKKDDSKGKKDDSKPSSTKATAARSKKDNMSPAPANAGPSGSPARRSRERSASATSSRRSTSPAKSTKKVKTAEEEQEAEAKRAEREAKKAEREEKKAAKEAEDEKKQKTKAKMSQAFAGFFKPTKPKAPAAAAAPVTAEAGPSSTKKPMKSDFHRHFKAPEQRANVVWAPISFFKASSTTTSDSVASSSSSNVSGWSASDFLSDHLGRHKRKAIRVARSRLSNGIKSAPLYGTVAEKWAEYQSAEDPRAVLRELRDSERFPWKTLAFDQQTRPPYCGTWTKKSVAVGPRTPLAQDPIFDYSYDSGDDWEEEEEAGGDDIDDVAQADPEDADSDMAEDDEFDDWLDNAEDPMFGGEQGPDIDGDVPMPFASPTRREAPKPVKKPVPKRVTKLIPRCLGPVWEENIGEAAADELDDYRIQLLNDAPHSIDPFKYTSCEPVQQFTTTYSDTAVGNYMGVKCLLSVQETAVSKPAVSKPTATSASSPMPLGDASSSANTAASASSSKPSSRPPPKVSFPAENLPELLRAIEGSTKIQSDLLSELRGLFEKVATKAAIEAKVREVAVREGKAKDSQWRVKAEAWTAAGITPPARGLAAMLSQAAQPV